MADYDYCQLEEETETGVKKWAVSLWLQRECCLPSPSWYRNSGKVSAGSEISTEDYVLSYGDRQKKEEGKFKGQKKHL